LKLKYWRDTAGPEVDYVLDVAHQYIPIEVKWSDKPDQAAAKHLKKFLDEYPETKQAYIISRTSRRYKISDKIMVLPWQEIKLIFEHML
jgi:predicted AAA+ superfamily ATPase